MNAPHEISTFEFSPTALEAARAVARAEARPLVDVLEAQSGLTADAFCSELANVFGYPRFSMADLDRLTPDFDELPFAEAASRGILALRDPSDLVRALFIVFGDPFGIELEAWIHVRFHGQAKLVLAHRADIAAYLTRLEGGMRAMDAIAEEHSANESADFVEDLSLVRISEDASTVVRLVNSTLYDALKVGASDVHIEREADGLVVKYRVDGVLVPITTVRGAETAERTISRIKVLAELDIAERRIPQDGRFRLRMQGRDVDFRVSIMPNIFGEDAVLRLLDRRTLTEASQQLTLNHLGIDISTQETIRGLSARPHGMLLVTGPTGSGKTTTLYGAITEINTGRDKIITIEDPVEYRLPQILQIPVNEKKGLTFALGLRSILRHDPDKIMVGEIRDGETAQIAVQAALTGHLVLTTVHANNVFDVLGRFLYMGVDPYSFSAALNGIVAQRLLRISCPRCVAPSEVDDGSLARLGLDRRAITGWRLMAGRGCGYCRGTGYKGRKAVAEVLLVDDIVRGLIATKAPITELKAAAATSGMRPIREIALELVAAGETTIDEVLRVVS
ncbi:GspE/PulE family protein [Burkholderia sp. 22PA0099]|uniref:GspE/PulE family protein n=1 Tax=Burkholderia sp. 22PA0099 TaxID=3237372 RepID=UPI0039C292D5